MTTTEAKKFIVVLETVKKYVEFLDAMVSANYPSAVMIQKFKFPEIGINEFGLADSDDIDYCDIDREIAKLNIMIWSGETTLWNSTVISSLRG